MPLIKGKSAKSFSKNVATEMEAHPSPEKRKQNLAIAYSMKRKAHKKAHGGEAKAPEKESDPMKSKRERALEKFYDGGQIKDNEQSAATRDLTSDPAVHEQAEYASDEFNRARPSMADARAAAEDERDLNQHGDIEEGPQGARMAEGGEAHQTDAHEMDMVGRIMAMRQKMYSEGGRIANEDQGESASRPDQMAKDKPNEFDDLALRDDLEFSDTAANSGDELGNAQEDSDRHDMVSRIMRSRAKKDRLPNPR